ncbi:MAG TPA: glycosyltransferase family 2 protein [Opitutaceae bacterium]|nr:glycosyltransferase family 2 protein [Opitutaceae bacterium]
MPSVSPPVSQLEVSVVMPCLNEASTIERCVREARGALAAEGMVGEVIVADNGSTDGSQKLAAQSGARVVAVEAKGYGNALRGGIEAARGRFVVMGDSDCSYDFTHVGRFVARLRAGDDLVMGNRFLGGIQPGAMPWKNRYLGNPVLSGLGRLFFRTPIRDFHCGLRAFSIDAYHRLDLRTTGMEFASEMVIKSTLLGLRVSEVPTILRPDQRGRPPHLRPWRDGWRHLRFMLLYSPRWLFLYPGAFLMVVGLAIVGLLATAPRTVGGVEFGPHSLLFAMLAVLLGFQAVFFAVCSRSYAAQAGLMPPSRHSAGFRSWFSLEAGLLIGAVLLVTGAGLSLGAVWHWRSQSFGPLDPEQVMRWVIPGAGALALGGQIMLGSFFLSVLDLRIRPGGRRSLTRTGDAPAAAPTPT